MGSVISFPPARIRSAREPNGIVHVVPSMRDGGSWDVMHESRSGDSWSVIDNHFSFDRALDAARLHASVLGACVAEECPERSA